MPCRLSCSDSGFTTQYLLEESPASIGRSFTSITQLLQLSLASADPSFHLPSLQTHLLSLTQANHSDVTPLPHDLLKALQSLTHNLPAVIRTATSLSSLVMRLDKLADLPTGPTAAAILILSLEAELSTSLPNAGLLAQALGARMGVSQRVVMERYKTIYDRVEEWIREVPWLESHERRKGRSKVAKRVVVARGLKDVVHFQDELWQRKMEGVGKPVLSLEEYDATEDEEDYQTDGGTSDIVALSERTSTSASGDRPFQMKRPTVYQRAVANTSQYFLSPLSVSSSSAPVVDVTGPSSKPSSPSVSDPDLFYHLLTVDDATLGQAFAGMHAPTRLQMLAAVRGGADEEFVRDDELFEDGELEGFFRSEEEIESLRTAFDWDPTRVSKSPSTSPKRKKKRKRAVEDASDHNSIVGPSVKRTKRINMNALAKILDPTVTADLGDDDEIHFSDPIDLFDVTWAHEGHPEHEALEEPGNVFPQAHSLLVPQAADGDGGEVVGEWRPLSPGGGGYDDEWYEM